jgi:serine/threonine protein kinase
MDFNTSTASGDDNDNIFFVGKPVDVWSVGVIMHLLLSCTMPLLPEITTARPQYDGSSFYDILEAQKYTDQVWYNVSPEAKRLLRDMLATDPSFRIPASYTLAHNWVGVGFALYSLLL